MTAPPIIFYRWTGEAMEPLRRFAKLCDQHFVIGEVYRLEPHEERSGVSHRHQFGWLREAWLNLPERYRYEPWAQSPEALRKYALIRTGWHDCQTFPCGSKAEAERWAAHLKPLDTYSLVLARGTVVERYTARSQSVRAMGKRAFQQSKQDIMDYVEDLLGVDRGTLAKEGEAA